MNEFKVSSGAHCKQTSEQFWEVTRSSLPDHSVFEPEALSHSLTPLTLQMKLIQGPGEVRRARGRSRLRLGAQLFSIPEAGLKPEF